MERDLASPWFVAWTAVCCAGAVAFVTWAAGAGSDEGRLGAGLVGLALGLVLAFAVPIAMFPERERRPEPLAAAVPGPWPVRPEPVPLHAPAPAPGPAAAAPGEAPTAVLRPDLAAQLAAGHALRLDLDHEPPAGRVDEWIAATRTLLERRPGVARYFAALDAKPWPDETSRLDAHLRRLETIVRDFA